MFFVGDSLRELSVSAISAARCAENPLVEGSLSNTTFCGNFSAPASGSCNIDDGGAALEKNDFGRWSVVGIVSFVYGCNTANAVAGFTNVAAYSDWISSVTSGELLILNLIKLKTKLTFYNEKFSIRKFILDEREMKRRSTFQYEKVNLNFFTVGLCKVDARELPIRISFERKLNSTMFRNIFLSTPIEFKSKVIFNFFSLNQSVNQSINQLLFWLFCFVRNCAVSS